MEATRRALTGTALVAAATVLAGCGSGGGASGDGPEIVAEYRPGDGTAEERRYPLVPGPLSGPGADQLPTPTVAWVDEGRYLGVVTWGSSSCPTGPDDVDVVDEQVIEISLARLTDGDVCTADMSPHDVVLDLPREIDPTEPLVARIEDTEVTIEGVS